MKTLPGFHCLGLSALLLFGTSAAVNAQGVPNAEQLAELQAQSNAATNQIQNYLNNIGYAFLSQRAAAVAAIRTQAQAQQRQQLVRQRFMELVGGVPATTGVVNVKQSGTVRDDNFTIENLMYESAPNYWVTANVFVPKGNGPFPALVIAPGHGAGKASQYSWAANFAANGYVVLSIDPMGQGERMQHYDAEIGNSKVEPSGEHEHANQSALLLDRHIARYWFADGLRGVDYLTSRHDVDAERIGTFGCSGGGTAAAYLAAMDTRIHAAAIASFITSFKELLPGNGPQDAEQTLPGFIAQGFDFADWVELAAPRALAIIAFKQDFFPYTGAEQTYKEASGFYEKFKAAQQLTFIGGEGGHCNLGPVTPQVVSFLNHHLKQSEAPAPVFPNRVPADPDALLVSASGQLGTSTTSTTVETMLRAEAASLQASHQMLHNSDELQALQNRVRADIRTLAKVSATAGAKPEVREVSNVAVADYHLQTIAVQSEPGVEVNAIVGIPSSSGIHPLIIRMEATPLSRIASDSEFVRLVKAGNIVVAFQPRVVLGEVPGSQSQLALGPYMSLSLRAMVVNKTITGMRVDDTVQLLNVLLARTDVNPAAVTLYARGALGITALHTCALDTRISHVMVENTLVSYNLALQSGLHNNLSEIEIPGVLRRYDTTELLQAISPRRVTLINPASAMGQRLRNSEVEQELAATFASDKQLGNNARVQILRRGARDPLPL